MCLIDTVGAAPATNRRTRGTTPGYAGERYLLRVIRCFYLPLAEVTRSVCGGVNESDLTGPID